MKKAKSPSRRIPWFYIIYFTVIAVALTTLVVVLKLETDLLAEYESVQPKYTAEAAFKKYFSPLDYHSILADAEYDAKGLSEEELTEYLSEQIGGADLSFSSASSSDSETMRYIVRAGSKQVAAIDIVKSAQKTKHGYSAYDFSKLELLIVVADPPAPPEPEKPKITVTVKAPIGYTVSVDGEVLDGALLSSTEHKADALPCYPSGTDGIDYNVYTLPEREELPSSVTAVCDDGEAEVVFDEQSNTYTAGVVYSEALKESYSDYVIEAIETFASYSHNVPGSSWESTKQYFDRSSQLYKDLRAIEANLWMEFTSESDSFEDVYSEEFLMLPDGVISCHVNLVQVLHRYGKDHAETLNMYVFLHEVDGKYKIFEWSRV